MNPSLNWSTTTSPQPMCLTPPSCTVITPRSSGTALTAPSSSSLATSSFTTCTCNTAMSCSEEGMATSSKHAFRKNASSSSKSISNTTSSASTSTSTSTSTTTGYRRPRPVSASDRRDCFLDRITVMRQQEVEFPYKICDYFASASNDEKSPSSSTTAPDASCRAKMVQWCTQVTDYCEFSRETVAVALSYVDRYLSIVSRAATSSAGHDAQQPQQRQQQPHQYSSHFTDEQRAPLHDRREYQLLCMTALHTAIKIREPLEMDTELVAELSRGTYTAADVAWMEQQLLQVLGWRLAGPTSLDFCRHLIELITDTTTTTTTAATTSITNHNDDGNDNNNNRVAETMVELCQLQTELASADYRFVPLNPSTVAVSSILNAIEALGEVVIVPTERLAMVEAIRRVTKIDVSAKAIRICRDELMRGLADITCNAQVADVAAADSISSDASCSGGAHGKFGRRESLGSSAEESPVSVVAHGGCCA